MLQPMIVPMLCVERRFERSAFMVMTQSVRCGIPTPSVGTITALTLTILYQK